MVRVQSSLAKQSVIQNQILAKQKDAMETMADELIMSIDLSTISESRQLFYEWKQKNILDKIKRQQEEEVEAEQLKNTNEDEEN